MPPSSVPSTRRCRPAYHQLDGKPGIETPERRIDGHDHQGTDKQQTQQRDQQPGFDVIQFLRNAAEQVIQKPHSQTGSKARDNGPPEPAGDPANRGAVVVPSCAR